MSGAFYGSLVASASVFVAILTVIKHREFCSLDIGHNARHDADTYHQQSVVESVFLYLIGGTDKHFGLMRGSGSSENSF
ncbi:MAG: hypothetical protein A07HR60_02355 [uncultured archaeon A07HR60]|nr:MAG: hypothetical protein A07HR60_02355 [uncultured archaeon A07HR60]